MDFTSSAAQLIQPNPTDFNCLDVGFYGHTSRILARICFEPMMHPLSDCEGLLECVFNFIHRAVGIDGAEGLQPHQYFRITVAKDVCSPIKIQEL